jgi:hypothetical protein
MITEFERLICVKPRFLFNKNWSSFRYDVWAEMTDAIEKLGLFINDEFLDTNIISKYADMLIRHLNKLKFDTKLYFHYVNYVNKFITKLIYYAESYENYESAYNFNELLKCYKKKLIQDARVKNSNQ